MNWRLLIPLLLLGGTVCAQEKTQLEIINSNYSYFDAATHPGMRRLVDSVIFEIDGSTMYCDSAWHYFKENKFEAFGDIHINQGDTLHLYGEHLDYIGAENKVFIQGNILLKDNEVQLTTDQLYYYLKSKKASYYTGANILNGINKLYSLKGDYFSEEKRLYFKKEVQIDNPEYTIASDTLIYNTSSEVAYFVGPTSIKSDNNFIYCENGWYNTLTDISQFNKNAYLWSDEQRLSGDSLYYDRKNGYGNAINNVLILDTINDYLLSGEWAEYFEQEDSSIITKNTLLTLIMEEDSLFLHGDTIKGTLDQNGKRFIKAYDNVRFFSDDLQGKCQYLTYAMADSSIHLYHRPVLWSEEQQLSGTDIILQLANNQLEALQLIDNAFISSPGIPNLYNQIKGKDMLGHFKNNKLHIIEVLGNGETIYVLKDETEKVSGVNTVSCSEMRIYVKENTIQHISFQKQPDATLYPLNELPKAWKVLKGFEWRGNERPLKLTDIF